MTKKSKINFLRAHEIAKKYSDAFKAPNESEKVRTEINDE